MRITKVLLVVLCVASLFISAQSARADMAPPPEIELGGLISFQDTEVQMMYERVEMELGMYYDDANVLNPTQNRVVVNAYFVMKNQGTADESMQAVFPSESMSICRGDTHGDSFTNYYILQDSFRVNIDGADIPTSTLEAPYGNCDNYRWLAFDITFPVNKDVLVKVSYVMETNNVDSAQNIDYILETGAGWKGNIGRGYIVLKFPYTVTTENVLSASTKGYQFLYNEIFWSFQDLEPTPQDNVHISIVSPNIWLEIRKLRDQIAKTPESPEEWIELINIYRSIGFDQKGDFIRNKHYVDLVESAYQQAIAVNPNSAELLADYAAYKLFSWSPHGEPITDGQAKQVLPLLSKAIALDPGNETALYVLSRLNIAAPFITFTPPPTIHPTATSLFTATPSITPSATITSIPSETPVVVTVIHTKIVNPPTSTQAPQLTAIPVPTEIDHQDETQEKSNSSTMIFGALIVFAVGVGVGLFWSKRTKR